MAAARSWPTTWHGRFLQGRIKKLSQSRKRKITTPGSHNPRRVQKCIKCLYGHAEKKETGPLSSSIGRQQRYIKMPHDAPNVTVARPASRKSIACFHAPVLHARKCSKLPPLRDMDSKHKAFFYIRDSARDSGMDPSTTATAPTFPASAEPLSNEMTEMTSEGSTRCQLASVCFELAPTVTEKT